MSRVRLPGLAVIALACIAALPASAQKYPDRPIKWIVSYTPGGSTDISARLFGNWLQNRLGQTVTIDNRPGGGNNIGTEAAVNSPADGYTVFLVNPANAINTSLYPNLKFNFLRDMIQVAGFMRVPNVMEVTTSLPAKTVAEFIDYVKAHPGTVNLASSGKGTSVHLSGELFMMMTGLKMQHVPYRGSAPALTDLIGGQVHVMFDNMPSSIENIKAGKLRALGVTTATRSDALPGVPTVGETVQGYEASAFFGLGVPKGTPPEVVDILNKEINAALADPEMVAKVRELGGVPIPGSVADFTKLVTDETEKWAKVVKASGAIGE